MWRLLFILKLIFTLEYSRNIYNWTVVCGLKLLKATLSFAAEEESTYKKRRGKCK